MSSEPSKCTVIVSGLPRSGTSVMMQMIAAGGVPALTDAIRAADEDNPRGYYEFERVKQIKQDKSWLADASGKVVKMVHLLLLDLPLDREYRIVFTRRRLEEVLASQKKMLERSGRAGAALNEAVLMKTFEGQVAKVLKYVSEHPANFRVMEVWYHELIAAPAEQAAKINAFLGGSLNEAAMSAAVDPMLYRNRKA